MLGGVVGVGTAVLGGPVPPGGLVVLDGAVVDGVVVVVLDGSVLDGVVVVVVVVGGPAGCGT